MISLGNRVPVVRLMRAGPSERSGLVRKAQRPLTLFLCRSNTASSILAEALIRHLAPERLRAASAGDFAAGHVHPFARECLRSHGIVSHELRSKPWGEFFGLSKAPVRFLIMLADVYAGSSDWSHDGVPPVKARWQMPDPSCVQGSDEDKRLAFEAAFATLDARIRRFLSLPLERITDDGLTRELARIGQEQARQPAQE